MYGKKQNHFFVDFSVGIGRVHSEQEVRLLAVVMYHTIPYDIVMHYTRGTILNIIGARIRGPRSLSRCLKASQGLNGKSWVSRVSLWQADPTSILHPETGNIGFTRDGPNCLPSNR